MISPALTVADGVKTPMVPVLATMVPFANVALTGAVRLTLPPLIAPAVCNSAEVAERTTAALASTCGTTVPDCASVMLPAVRVTLPAELAAIAWPLTVRALLPGSVIESDAVGGASDPLLPAMTLPAMVRSTESVIAMAPVACNAPGVLAAEPRFAIWLAVPCSNTAPLMPPLLNNVPAIKVPVPACVTPPVVVVMSTSPVFPEPTNPASVSAWLSTTVKVPPAVTPEIVPIWLAAPCRIAAPAIPPVLVNVPATNVPVLA